MRYTAQHWKTAVRQHSNAITKPGVRAVSAEPGSQQCGSGAGRHSTSGAAVASSGREIVGGQQQGPQHGDARSGSGPAEWLSSEGKSTIAAWDSYLRQQRDQKRRESEMEGWTPVSTLGTHSGALGSHTRRLNAEHYGRRNEDGVCRSPNRSLSPPFSARDSETPVRNSGEPSTQYGGERTQHAVRSTEYGVRSMCGCLFRRLAPERAHEE